MQMINTTVCPSSSDPLYIVSNNIKRVTTSWAHNICISKKYFASGRFLDMNLSILCVARILLEIFNFIVQKHCGVTSDYSSFRYSP